ncbi:NAD(P)H-hydrate dehydratase [Rhodovarius lipocyclicus]|uniref:NAD(P)H-hydrate dehydratase n=1 Tax=Rhodovarius lipocyclicus TaxID=268410 RepID=UPI0019173ACF|nr:NAD(P)H-hydrate dehydratase [Rhodovarius lipocyclicus]
MSAELLSAAAMRAVEAAAMAAGTPGFVLMRRAAAAVARQASAMAPPGATVAVLCGPGNNGGDGFAAAALLREAGYRVSVHLLGEAAALKGDAARAAALWSGPVAGPALPACSLITDALFGIGLNRAPQGAAAEAIAAMNAHGAPILAVDVPSGLDADTGAAPGAVVRAAHTVTFHRAKPGHWLLPGRDYCGALTVADIGLLEAPGTLFRNDPALWAAHWPRPGAGAHKYTRGACLVWSGPALATGAARLSAMAALRAGAGIVTLAGDRAAMTEQAAHVTAPLLRVAEMPGELLADPRLVACLIGPGAGLGPATRARVEQLLASTRALVLDADALTVMAGAPQALRRAPPLVLTPHEGEFRTLFGPLPGPKPARALAAARASGAVVVLKGADTVIAAPDGRAAINGNAPPWLATAGSGDVLAGLVAGLLAQGMPAFEAACAAVFAHGAAGMAAGPHLIAEDLPGALYQVLRGWEEERGRGP